MWLSCCAPQNGFAPAWVPPSTAHSPEPSVGVDANGHRGWYLLHWIPMGIPNAKYDSSSPVPPVSSLANAFTVHEASYIGLPAPAVVAAVRTLEFNLPSVLEFNSSFVLGYE